MPINPACQTYLPQLSPYIDGELPPNERQVLERHLQVCKDCTMRVADLRAESGLVRVGLDMAADEVDFRDFAQKVMARITPEKPPLLERLRMSLSETFLHQRRVMVSSFVTAAVVLAVAVPFLMRSGTPAGYAGERMMVEGVKADPGARVAPVVYETDTGDAIIWMMDPPPAAPAQGTGDEAKSEELDIESGAPERVRPTGGDL